MCWTAAIDATLVVNVSGDRYSFAHAMVEHALYDAFIPARRVRAHRRVAEAIERACGADPGRRVGELAYHWAQGTTPADAVKAVGYARAAGDRALAQLAPGEALRWYDQALSLLDEQTPEMTVCAPVRRSDWVTRNAKPAILVSGRACWPPAAWPIESATPAPSSPPLWQTTGALQCQLTRRRRTGGNDRGGVGCDR